MQYGANLRSGFFVPMLIETFAENGFNVRRHGLKVISELQNGCYDKYMRRAIKMILKARRECLRQDINTVCRYVKTAAAKFTDKIKPQAA